MNYLERLTEIGGHLGPTRWLCSVWSPSGSKIGQQRYGALQVASDRRGFGGEALEAAVDGLVYAAVALMRGGRTAE